MAMKDTALERATRIVSDFGLGLTLDQETYLIQQLHREFQEHGSEWWYKGLDTGHATAIRDIQSIAGALESEGADPKFIESMRKFANLLSKTK